MILFQRRLRSILRLINRVILRLIKLIDFTHMPYLGYVSCCFFVG